MSINSANLCACLCLWCKSRRVEIQHVDLGNIEDVGVDGGPEAEAKGNRMPAEINEPWARLVVEVSVLLGPQHPTADCEYKLRK